MVTHIIPIAFHSKQLYHPIKEYGGNKIIFVISNPKDTKSKEKIKDAVKNAKKIAKMLNVQCEILRLKKDFDVEERIKTFKKLMDENDEIIINLTGGPKFDALILYLVANMYAEKVKAIIYIREDVEEIVHLPFLPTQDLTPFEKEILILLEKPISAQELSKKTGKSLAQIIKYVNELERKGLIESRKEGRRKILMRKKNLILKEN